MITPPTTKPRTNDPLKTHPQHGFNTLICPCGALLHRPFADLHLASCPHYNPPPQGNTLLTAYWQYANQNDPAPGTGQIRTDSTLTQMWIAEQDTDGMIRAVGLGLVEAGNAVFMRAANHTLINLTVTGTPVDNGNYWTFPIAFVSGTISKGSRTEVNFIVPTPIVP